MKINNFMDAEKLVASIRKNQNSIRNGYYFEKEGTWGEAIITPAAGRGGFQLATSYEGVKLREYIPELDKYLWRHRTEIFLFGGAKIVKSSKI